jgi:hypothetical protein
MNDWHIPERFPLAPEEELDVRLIAATQYRMEAGTKATADGELKAADKAVADEITELKRRRREAIKSCYYDCPMKARLMCLDEGLKSRNLEHGIWGAYPESERRQIADAIAARRNPMTRRQAATIIVSEEKKRALQPS